MMRRYPHNAGTAGSPSGCRFNTSSVINETSDTVTEATPIIGGPTSGTVTIKITSYGGVPGSYFNLNGTNRVLGDEITFALDAGGGASITTITHCGPPVGGGGSGGFSVQVTIIAVSAGIIGSPSTRTYSHTS